MNRKKKIIIISIVAVVILIGVLLGVYIYNDNKNQYSKVTTTSKNETNKANDTEDLTEVEKEIVGVETADDSDNMEEEAFSDLYKEYLELSDEEKEKNEVIPRKQEVPFESLEDIKEKLNEGDTQKNEEKDKEENKIPERFNLAEKIDIKVENQGDYGLCWGFASLKSLETYLALNELGNYDFSEMHLDYIQSDLMYGYRELHTGGNFSEFKEYITVSGVVLESDVPYREHSEEEYSKFTDIRKITEVTETIEFPSLYKNEDSEHTDKEITDFRETVKKHIMKNGGLYASIVGTGAKNHYTDIENSEFMNHAVTIVGWDDNYSKDNFLSSTGKKPSKDGAYIALNSWGTFWNDGGYYYISYEDKFVETNLSGILSTSIESAYKINSIENETIKEYLVNNYEHIFIDYQGEDYITKNTISNITSLDLSNKDISSLDGIEIFENLSDLKLSNNKIKDVTPITKLKSLFLLDLSNNDITDISPLGDMKTKYLNIINLSNNKIKDVSALGNIKSEYGLDIDISKNPNVIGYEKLNNIYGLNISNCYVTDVNALSNFERLSSLKISNTPGIIGLDNLPESIYELDISEFINDKK